MTPTTLDLRPTTSITAARVKVMHEVCQNHNQVVCPVCDGLVKEYKRKLHSAMAMFLIKLIKQFDYTKDWVHTREIFSGEKAATDGSYLVHWGLVEKRLNKSGYYKPTMKGRLFAGNFVRVPHQVYLLNNKVQGWSVGYTSIVEALGDKFNYEELMSSC